MPRRAARRAWPPLARVAAFAALFLILQNGWSRAAGSELERWVIDRATVATAAAAIRAIDPASEVVAAGSRLRSPGGGINVLNGCEGTDALLLLQSALAVAPLAWRHRAAGMAVGLALVFLLNQVRVVGLFYAFRRAPAAFDLLHGFVAPVLLVAAAGAFFAVWLERFGPVPPDRE
ncbi:MAG: exosortase/archaeosortase family protein [Betaproteobacteria bacterium]|jgi:exosortase/archaeosortase family protein